MTEPDWTHWRSFAAVVEHGSLSGAARHLGVTQPTMGRHIEELERTLGVTLFERTLQGLKPTETGLRLFEPIRSAQQSLAQAALMAEGTQEALRGAVRITSSNVTCHYVLPPMLERGRGKIVNVGARPAVKPVAGLAAYAAMKAAVVHLTEALAAETTAAGVQVNAILPSTIDTPANRVAMPQADPAKWVRPESVGRVIRFLCSAEADDVSGAVIPVYGRA